MAACMSMLTLTCNTRMWTRMWTRTASNGVQAVRTRTLTQHAPSCATSKPRSSMPCACRATAKKSCVCRQCAAAWLPRTPVHCVCCLNASFCCSTACRQRCQRLLTLAGVPSLPCPSRLLAGYATSYTAVADGPGAGPGTPPTRPTTLQLLPLA